MVTVSQEPPKADPQPDIERLLEQFDRKGAVRARLSGGGRIHIDRPLPFLCVHRSPPDVPEATVAQLVTGEAAYLVASGAKPVRAGVRRLVDGVVGLAGAQFGAFMIVEVWAGAVEPADPDRPPEPRFRIESADLGPLESVVAELKQALETIKVAKRSAVVTVEKARRRTPPALPQIWSRESAPVPCYWLGIEVAPIWRGLGDDQDYPIVRRVLRRRFSTALQRMLLEFVNRHTTHRPRHFHALGKRAMVRAVWDADRQLAAIQENIPFLLLMTPSNAGAAWAAFRRRGYSVPPRFYYRPLPQDPSLLKRALFDIRIERVEDPALGALLRQKRRELDLRLSMLSERETRNAIHTSQQLFGEIGSDLVESARSIVAKIRPGSRETGKGAVLDASAFAERARAEIERYRGVLPGQEALVEIRADVEGLMVSRNTLLIGQGVKLPASRVEALLQHEVGTHLLTWLNGAVQPLQMLRWGTAGYDELQEGLAVLAEYLVGGLSRPRLRLLAGRVLAADARVRGADFPENFRLLHETLGFPARTAFMTVMRVHRGGGFTKDAIYLRGFLALVAYLRDGGDLDPLLVGKISAQQIPVILELQRRRVLRPAPLRPRYLEDAAALERLQRLRDGESVLPSNRKGGVR